MDIQFSFLKDLKEHNRSIYLKTISWIKSLTVELDYEEGNAFSKFVKRNIKLPYPFEVFVAYSSSIDDVIGIASLIPDDQQAGKELNLDGIWLGGVNIRRDYRNKGYGKKLIENIDRYLNTLENKPLRVNLFSNNPIAIHLYKK